MNKEFERIIHELKNIRTVQDVSDYNIKRQTDRSTRLNKRIKLLEQQIDQLVKKGGIK